LLLSPSKVFATEITSSHSAIKHNVVSSYTACPFRLSAYSIWPIWTPVRLPLGRQETGSEIRYIR